LTLVVMLGADNSASPSEV